MTDDDDWIGPWPAGALPVTSNHWPSTKGTHPMTDAINLAERQEIMADSFDTPAVVDTCRRTAARLRQQQARNAEFEVENKRLRAAMVKENETICQILGKALRYPWFKDDQKNFPGATEADGICQGDEVAASMASGAARRIAELEAALRELVDEFGGTLAEYEHAGPHFTHKDGPEVFNVAVITDRAELLERAQKVLTP